MINQGTILLTLPLLLQIVPGTVGHPAPSEDGSLCRNGDCGSDNTRGHGSTWGKGDSNGETGTPETVTVTVISTDQLPGPTTTVPGPTNTVTITTDGPAVISTITETLTSTVTDAITSNQVVTDTETVTVTVTNPGTITTATTTATTTVTSCPTNGAGSSDGPDYGTCSDPTIRWADGLDGRTEYSWITNDQDDFPHGSSSTINTLMDFVCNRLRSSCNAPQAAINRCYSAAARTAALIFSSSDYQAFISSIGALHPIGRSVGRSSSFVVRREWLVLLAKVYDLSPAYGCASLPLFVGNP
ncbi:hypothetical protein BDV39DRAFT_217725 [Aspergillus sergii]|uniref:Uncharacterized protein n=1 Tax=Aspergillus sergii TaxID=1034303 RepID=A0A5N6WS96_9EURO|nr:hypothetical protein BDV39DRAFT_217725 [Aspergillus sergii]